MNVLSLKSKLLSLAKIKISEKIQDQVDIEYRGNLNKDLWVFLKLNESSRVRLTISDDAKLLLDKKDKDNLIIFDLIENTVLIENVVIEQPLAHAPEQMFFTLYRTCKRGCKFCPLTYSNEKAHHSLNDIIGRIKGNKTPLSIGITTASPPYLETKDIVDEICFIASKIKETTNSKIPIGVSLNSPNADELSLLKKYGIDEIRLNLETPNEELAKSIMPNKPIKDIYCSIENAVNTFGAGKVSSNIIVGLGESDEDIISGVEKLASIGSIATLYPYDPIKNNHMLFFRPSELRLYNLALSHKQILQKYGLHPMNLKTMCCSCAASHILPEKDF